MTRSSLTRSSSVPHRVPGSLKGKIWIADDFDEPDPELEDLFYNAPIVVAEDDER